MYLLSSSLFLALLQVVLGTSTVPVSTLLAFASARQRYAGIRRIRTMQDAFQLGRGSGEELSVTVRPSYGLRFENTRNEQPTIKQRLRQL